MENTTSKATFLITGIGIGIAVGILFAPKSGRQTREFLKQKTDDYVVGTARDLRELVKRGKEVISEERQSISDAIHAARDSYSSHHPHHNGLSVTNKHAENAPAD